MHYQNVPTLLEPNHEWVKANFERIRHEGNLKFNDTWFERSVVKKTVTLPVRKLDTVLADLGKLLAEQGKPMPKFHFLKSDTQSGEFYVLEGAENWLKTDCIGLEIEAFRYPMYKGVVIDTDVKKYLEKLGFEQIGWTGYMYSFNAACDYLFVRKHPRNSEEKQLIASIKAIYQPKGRYGIIKQITLQDQIRRRIAKLKKLFGIANLKIVIFIFLIEVNNRNC